MSGVGVVDVLNAIADTMKRGGAPLSDDQRMLLAGCLAVWLDKYAEQHNTPARGGLSDGSE